MKDIAKADKLEKMNPNKMLRGSLRSSGVRRTAEARIKYQGDRNLNHSNDQLKAAQVNVLMERK